MKLLIKCCGGCNPSINRKKLVEEVVHQLKALACIELTGEGADVGLIVAGCPVCCVNLNDIKDRASKLVVVGGHLVNYVQVPPDQQTSMIIQQILDNKGKTAC